MGPACHHREMIVYARAMRGLRPHEDYQRWWSQAGNDSEVDGGAEDEEAGPETEEWGGGEE